MWFLAIFVNTGSQETQKRQPFPKLCALGISLRAIPFPTPLVSIDPLSLCLPPAAEEKLSPSFFLQHVPEQHHSTTLQTGPIHSRHDSRSGRVRAVFRTFLGHRWGSVSKVYSDSTYCIFCHNGCLWMCYIPAKVCDLLVRQKGEDSQWHTLCQSCHRKLAWVGLWNNCEWCVLFPRSRERRKWYRGEWKYSG